MLSVFNFSLGTPPIFRKLRNPRNVVTRTVIRCPAVSATRAVRFQLERRVAAHSSALDLTARGFQGAPPRGIRQSMLVIRSVIGQIQERTKSGNEKNDFHRNYTSLFFSLNAKERRAKNRLLLQHQQNTYRKGETAVNLRSFEMRYSLVPRGTFGVEDWNLSIYV